MVNVFLCSGGVASSPCHSSSSVGGGDGGDGDGERPSSASMGLSPAAADPAPAMAARALGSCVVNPWEATNGESGGGERRGGVDSEETTSSLVQQEAELRQLLSSTTGGRRARPTPEEDDHAVTTEGALLPPPPPLVPTERRPLAAAAAAVPREEASERRECGVVASAGPGPGSNGTASEGSGGVQGGGCGEEQEAESGAAAAEDPDSHPVLVMYRSIGEPLDPMSFKELKRRVETAVEKDGAGPASVSEIKDFLGVLKRFREDQLERAMEPRVSSNQPLLPPSAAAAAASAASAAAPSIQEEEEAQEEGAAEGGVHDAAEGFELKQVPCSADAKVDGRCHDAAAGPPVGAAPPAPGSLSEIILKFTTVADGNQASSFAVRRDAGATVGRGPGNDISIPNDSCMGESDHASIVWRGGAFYVEDRGHPYGASVRIGTGRGLRDWPLDQGSVFSAGNSVFHTTEIDDERGMLLEIVAGPLKGERRRVQKNGATVGRATESTISIADRELSRKHSTIECDESGRRHLSTDMDGGGGRAGAGAAAGDAEGPSSGARSLRGAARPRGGSSGCSSGCGSPDSPTGRLGNGGGDVGDSDGSSAEDRASPRGNRAGQSEYYLCDVGSTNGTYVQLVGPYASSRRLELSDHILIGRTGFSINRYDWGVWEDRGARRTMEDKSVVIQDMGVESLTALGLGPQTFLAVYDGHGGGEASAFLWRRLHVAVAEALEDAAPRIAEALEQDRLSERLAVFGSGGGGGGEAMRCDDRRIGDDEDASENIPAVFLSSGGVGGGGGGGGGSDGGDASGGMAPLLIHQTPSLESSRPALAIAATAAPEVEGVTCGRVEEDDGATDERWFGREPGVRSDDPRSVSAGGSSGSRGGKGSWWGGDPVGGGVAAMGAKPSGSSLSKASSMPRAPSLPMEWLIGARERAKATDKGDAAVSGISDPPPKVGGGGGGSTAPAAQKAEPGSGSGGDSPTRCDGCISPDAEGSPAAGGDAASGIGAETGGAGGGRVGGAGDGQAAVDGGVIDRLQAAESDGGEEASGGFGVASAPPSAGSGSGSQGGIAVQSPGGGPSRPLATAGLPADGGGGGVIHEGGGGAGHDRHNTSNAVDRVIQDVVTRAFLATDEEFLTTSPKPSSGSTATTAMVLGDRFYGFNVGDSRTILCRAGRAEVVSKDHKPAREDETERIKRAGGMVINKRVMGELAVSRAFGDRAFKIGIKAILREEDEHQQSLAREGEQGVENGGDDGDGGDEDEYGDGDGDGDGGCDDGNDDDGDEGVDEADEDYDGLNHTADHEPSTADQNSLTIGRGSSRKLLPPSGAAPSAPPDAQPAPLAPPSAPAASPPPPPPPAANVASAAGGSGSGGGGDRDGGGKDGMAVKRPVTDPTDALITAEPEMLSCRITPEDEFILLACDGLFDVLSSEEVVKIVRKELRKHGDTQRVCEALTRKAIDELVTHDNVSVVLVVLKKFW